MTMLSGFLKTTFAIAAVCFLVACSDEPSQKESSLSIIANNEQETVLMPGYDIEWYNESTSELKFSKVPADFSNYFGGMTFTLDGKALFEVTAVLSDANSQVIPSAVIYRDNDGKYYLNDCYPMIEAVTSSPEVQTSREERAAAMESFKAQLKLEKRLK